MKSRDKKSFMQRKNLLALLGGLCFSLPFLCEYLFPFTLVGAALLEMSLYCEGRIKKPFLRTFLFGLFFYMPLYYWFIALYPFDAFGFSMTQGFFVVGAACIGISTYHSLIFAACISLITYAADKAGAGKAFAPMYLAVAFMADEWLISIGPLGFAWGKTAIAQIGFLPAVQTSSLFGSYFVTFIAVASGAFLGACALYKDKRRLLAVLAGTIYGINALVGTVLYFLPENTEKSYEVAIAQGNVLSNEKWEDKGETSKSRYLSLINTICEDGAPDLIVLPESAFPFVFNKNKQLIADLSEIAAEHDVTIASGVIISEGKKNYNALITISPDGTLSEPYCKRHLVPFGEYVPKLFENMSIVESLNLGDFQYTAGTDSALITLDGETSLGGLVCFDSIFSSLARESVSNGAELLVVVTNDSWYEDTRGVYQHAAFSRLRAIENGRYVVRAANTGISMLIDTKGCVIDSLGALEMGTLEGTVYTVSSLTLFTYIGDCALVIIPLLIVISHIIYILKLRKNI